jgi:hypothetical protein
VVNILLDESQKYKKTVTTVNTAIPETYSNTPGGIRTHDLRFRKPLPNLPNNEQNHGLTESCPPDSAESTANLLQKYPELAQVIDAWPTLNVDT